MIEAVPELADYLPGGAGYMQQHQQQQEGDKDEERYGGGGGGDDSCTMSPVSEISQSSRARNGNNSSKSNSNNGDNSKSNIGSSSKRSANLSSNGKTRGTGGTHTYTHTAATVTMSSPRVVAAAGPAAGPSLPPQLSRQLTRPLVEQGPVQAFQDQQQDQQEQQVMIKRKGKNTLATVLRDNGDGTFFVKFPDGEEASVEKAKTQSIQQRAQICLEAKDKAQAADRCVCVRICVHAQE